MTHPSRPPARRPEAFRRSLAALCAAGCLLLGAVVHAEPGNRAASADDAAVGLEPPHNICFGGLEDRKRILPEEQIENPFRETTVLGCALDGGEPTVVPDLPRPTRNRTVLG